jgi:hypothetical protein
MLLAEWASADCLDLLWWMAGPAVLLLPVLP